MAVQILVYDDSDVMRESLRTLLFEEPGFEVIAMLPNAETVETDINELKPEVVLMDIDMPEVNGVEAVKRIRKLNPQLPIIMLTVFDDNENIFKAIYAGASGYILKRYVTVEIVAAIRNVLSGGAPMTGTVAKKVLQMLPVAVSAEEENQVLTIKEKDILQLLVNGYSYKMIASEINISIDTVRFHIKKIYDKLHVHSSTAAVSKAIKEKLV
ncbi:MAG TPA: response regulator transcription factor [Chitinophagaceae bacterium]|nr:response regulator transcription factor [Chitinophagaceae bacterium]